MSEKVLNGTNEKPGNALVVVALGIPKDNPTGVIIDSKLPMDDTLTVLQRAIEKVRVDLIVARLDAREQNKSRIVPV